MKSRFDLKKEISQRMNGRKPLIDKFLVYAETDKQGVYEIDGQLYSRQQLDELCTDDVFLIRWLNFHE